MSCISLIFVALHHCGHAIVFRLTCTILITHLVVWSYSAGAAVLVREFTEEAYICFMPWTSDSDYFRVAVMAIPFLIVGIAIVRISRYIGLLRKNHEAADGDAGSGNEADSESKAELGGSSTSRVEASPDFEKPLLDVAQTLEGQEGNLEPDIGDGHAAAFRRLQTQVQEAHSSLHSVIARFVLLLYTMVCFLMMILAIVLDVAFPENRVRVRVCSPSTNKVILTWQCLIVGHDI